MERSVPLAFGLLGAVLGSVGRLQRLAPALASDPSTSDVPLVGLGIGLFVLSTVGVAAVGYWAAESVHLPGQYARFALTAGVAGGLGFFVGGAATVAAAPVPTGDTLAAVAFGAYNALTRSVSIGLLGLAGASVAHFRET